MNEARKKVTILRMRSFIWGGTKLQNGAKYDGPLVYVVNLSLLPGMQGLLLILLMHLGVCGWPDSRMIEQYPSYLRMDLLISWVIGSALRFAFEFVPYGDVMLPWMPSPSFVWEL